jgi:rhamnopyranosyl-N-acetylglucosaminyl-diphospho-decaprenol beta-1,3/1,4-galactofuranosyltransferase
MFSVATSADPVTGSRPTVCAVLVTFNRRELLEQTLDKLDAQTRRPDTVLVIDNASTDGTDEFLRDREGVEVLRMEENGGGAGGFEAGLRHAFAMGYDWYWLLDDDTFAEETTLQALLDGADRAPADPSIMTSVVRWKDATLHPMNQPWPRWNRRVDFAKGATVGMFPIRRATFVSTLIRHDAVAAHGFPPGHYFIWHDDTEYTGRMLAEGNGWMVPDSVVWHWTPKAYDVVSDARGRFYYKVRNHLWMLRGKAFTGPERIWGWYSLLAAINTYVRRSESRRDAVTTVLRGIRDGIRPEPT